MKQMATKANISEFAYFPPPPGASGGRARWSDRFQLPELARLLLDNEQDWKSVDEYGVEDKYGALCKYVQYSFAYIVETQPDKLKCSANDQWVVFDTRLTSSFELLLEPIYMLFQKNHNDRPPHNQPWYFKKWCVGWGHVLRETSLTDHTHSLYGPRPPPPFSTEKSSNELPDDWKEFKPKREFVANTSHILEDNLPRLRQVWRDAGEEVPSDGDIARAYSQALCLARNPRLNQLRMLPQLYRPGGLGRGGNGWVRQLLMPIHLRGGPAADIALAIDIRHDPDSDGDYYYFASTVLSLGQAYLNARLVHSVESPWLRNVINEQRVSIDEPHHEQWELVGAPSDGHVEGRDEAVPSSATTVTDAAGSAEVVWPPSVGTKLTARWNATSRYRECTVVRVDNGMNVFVNFDGWPDTCQMEIDNVRNVRI